MTLALAYRLRGPRNPHTLRRLQRELLYDDADRIDSWGPGQELAQEPRVLAAVPTSKQDDLVALVISGVYRQPAVPIAWHTSWGPRPGSPGLTISAACGGGWCK